MGELIGLTSVLRSMVENASSPTVLMRHVMRSVNDVLVRHVVGRGRDVLVVGVFAVPAMPDMPPIPVTSKAVIARTESFLKSIIHFSPIGIRGLKYMECSNRQYFRDSTISRTDNFEK